MHQRKNMKYKIEEIKAWTSSICERTRKLGKKELLKVKKNDMEKKIDEWKEKT